MGTKNPIVLDNGTGYAPSLSGHRLPLADVCYLRSYTKLGFAGNFEPQYIFSTLVGNAMPSVPAKKNDIPDLDFIVGDDALGKARYNIDYPIRHGIIDNWDNMEKLWQRCFYQYLPV